MRAFSGTCPTYPVVRVMAHKNKTVQKLTLFEGYLMQAMDGMDDSQNASFIRVFDGTYPTHAMNCVIVCTLCFCCKNIVLFVLWGLRSSRLTSERLIRFMSLIDNGNKTSATLSHTTIRYDKQKIVYFALPT